MDSIALALDSNTMTYLNEAMEPGYHPDRDKSKLCRERVSLLRIFLYKECHLCILPTVKSEYEAIKDSLKRNSHSQLHIVHMFEPAMQKKIRIDELASCYLRFHSKKKDCRILAEAEEVHSISRIDYLLTCDKNFLGRLSSQTTSVSLILPSVLWSTLEIPRGAPPKLTPHPTNPLSKQIWWQWK